MGDARVGVGRRRRGVADGQVDAEVTATHAEEGQDVKEEKRDHIDLRRQRLHVHGEADTHLHHKKQIQTYSKITQCARALNELPHHNLG